MSIAMPKLSPCVGDERSAAVPGSDQVAQRIGRSGEAGTSRHRSASSSNGSDRHPGGAGPAGSCAFLSRPCTAFCGDCLLATGTLNEVALVAWGAIAGGATKRVTIFDDATGGVVELDLRGSKAALIGQLYEQAAKASLARNANTASAGMAEVVRRAPRGRGRPRLGVVAREVTLLPRHWEWLANQPGGASMTLRQLVEQACRPDRALAGGATQREAALGFLHAVGKSHANHDAAARALRAGDDEGLRRALAQWPADLRAYALRLARDATQQAMPAPVAAE